MKTEQALEMVEALLLDNENSIDSLNKYGDEVAIILYKEYTTLKVENEELETEIQKLNTTIIKLMKGNYYTKTLREIKYFVENKEADADFVIRQVEQVVDEALTSQPEHTTSQPEEKHEDHCATRKYSGKAIKCNCKLNNKPEEKE